jgi:hypothetical protein
MKAKLMGSTCAATIVLLSCTRVALGQSPGTGSISGHVLSEQGLALRATVALSFAAARRQVRALRARSCLRAGTGQFTLRQYLCLGAEANAH